MNTHKWTAGLTLLILLIALAGCQLVEEARTWVEDTIEERTTDQEEPLIASGTIQADEIRIAGELGGRIVAVHARRGDPVRAGDLLVTLDETPLLAELRQAEAAVAVAEANLTAARAGARSEAIDAARAALDVARAESDGYRAAWENAQAAIAQPQALDAQIAEARTAVALGEQGVALAEAELAKQRLIRDQKGVGSVERDAAEWQVQAAEAARAAAEADLKAAQTLLNGLWAIRREPLALIAQAHVAEGQYRLAEAGVVTAQARLDDLLAGPTAREVAVAAQALRLERAKRAAVDAQRALFALTSPVDGVVLDQVLYAGELATPAATILTVADLSQVRLTVYVPVNEVGYVQLGQQVRVTVDSQPGQVFSGHVSQIGDQPEFTPRNVATQEERLNTFYAVEIRLDNAARLLKPGMPAEATFLDVRGVGE
ncbi:MAG: efflux RND transporter periplasmic adaptor subunit [Anaerolineae bacterium]|nr:efflux RND transporter periplasmic adaptor subunit [Anaerolineae bacterium]